MQKRNYCHCNSSLIRRWNIKQSYNALAPRKDYCLLRKNEQTNKFYLINGNKMNVTLL